MNNVLIYLIFLEDLSCYTQKDEPVLETFQQAEDGYLDILRVEKDGRVCRYTGPQKDSNSYWEVVDSFESFQKEVPSE